MNKQDKTDRDYFCSMEIVAFGAILVMMFTLVILGLKTYWPH